MGTQSCPVCLGRRLTAFLHRLQVPVHQNLVESTPESARSAPRGDIDLTVCSDCGFVFNRSFDLSRLAYGADYDNRQTCSAYFDDYLDGLVEYLVERQGVRHKTIVEVGCGKGEFLRKLVNYPGANNTGVGFDPSYVGPDEDRNNHLTFRRSFYDSDCADVKADVVVCRHVIEHVADPLVLLHSVRSALLQSPNARVFFETPCVDWILRNKVVWDIFYEHCSLFHAASLTEAFSRSGFAVQRVNHIFGGQYLWLEATPSHIRPVTTSSSPDTAALAKAYAVDEGVLLKRLLAKLLELKRRGKVALWGAGAKGATFANLIDPTGILIDCVVDLNPNKQGGYISGSAHPIVAPAELAPRGVSSAVLMNPNYRAENFLVLAKAGIAIDLIDWSEQ